MRVWKWQWHQRCYGCSCSFVHAGPETFLLDFFIHILRRGSLCEIRKCVVRQNNSWVEVPDGAAIQQQGKRLQNNFRNVCWAILSRSRPIRSPSFMLWDMCSILPMYYCNVLLHRHTNTHCVYSFASIELRHWRHHLITTTTRVEGNRCNLRSGVCVCSWICISCIHFTRVRTICMYRKKKRSTNE